MIDEKRLAVLRKHSDKFQVGNAAQQIADLRFLFSVVDELLAAKQKAAFLIKQIGESTYEKQTEDYRQSSFTTRRVCTKTAFNAAREATA